MVKFEKMSRRAFKYGPDLLQTLAGKGKAVLAECKVKTCVSHSYVSRISTFPRNFKLLFARLRSLLSKARRVKHELLQTFVALWSAECVSGFLTVLHRGGPGRPEWQRHCKPDIGALLRPRRQLPYSKIIGK